MATWGTRYICDFCDEPIFYDVSRVPCGEDIHPDCVKDHACNCTRYDCATLYEENYDSAVQIIMQCEHDIDEDCMYCVTCGSGCREDLDENDECPDCALRWTIFHIQVKTNNMEEVRDCLNNNLEQCDYVKKHEITKMDTMDL